MTPISRNQKSREMLKAPFLHPAPGTSRSISATLGPQPWMSGQGPGEPLPPRPQDPHPPCLLPGQPSLGTINSFFHSKRWPHHYSESFVFNPCQYIRAFTQRHFSLLVFLDLSKARCTQLAPAQHPAKEAILAILTSWPCYKSTPEVR